MWAPFANPDGTWVWRVEEDLGMDYPETPRPASPVPSGTADQVDLVLLDDGDLGFREDHAGWPQSLSGARWIVLQMARRVAHGPLWEHLRSAHARQLVVVTTAEDLRRTDVQISRQLSWERTAQDVFWELTHNPRVNGLSQCAHVIVSFGTSGAVLLSPRDRQRPCRLIFDPAEIEGSWSQRHPGGVIGSTSCLTAAVARQLLLNPDAPDPGRAIQGGIAAMRALHLAGYGPVEPNISAPALVFPSQRLAEALARETADFAEVDVLDPVESLADRKGASPPSDDRAFWTILGDHRQSSLEKIATEIVLHGAKNVLTDVPLGRFGALVTADRREIESYRGMHGLISEYCRQPVRRPLCIAAFGPPGSGKSFGVVQVANSVPGLQVKELTFNLSQFRHPDELLSSLHQVRDAALLGKIPLVFWDEFDTALGGEALGWLRYFLVPMQDGVFQEGQISHPIGRAIFVFAGGTCRRMDEFDRGPDDPAFKSAKGPDFVSRLKGYLDVLGPNRVDPGPAADPSHIIRRALLLRSILSRNVPAVFEDGRGHGRLRIDPGVLRAMLRVERYRHGVRSMESLIAMSRLADRTRFERSCLPAEDQLALHVNGPEFLALVQQPLLEGDLLERLATGAHEIYCQGLIRDGWRLGTHRSEAEKTHELLVPYAELPKEFQESNRVTVRNIPVKLARVGCVMRPARSNETPIQFSDAELETLAELEHQLWMDDKLAAGFRLGEPGDPDPNRHEHLVPWELVPERVKEIDRCLVRGIPTLLAHAGYAIERLRPDNDWSTAGGGKDRS